VTDVAHDKEKPAAGKRPSSRRRMIGLVTSDKMDKTVTVEVTRFKMDAVYKKYVRVTKRYKAHDEKNEYHVGDRVEILEHRPVSRTKRWRVTRVVDRAVQELG
jgi:small subunit ribosomal protein S17